MRHSLGLGSSHQLLLACVLLTGCTRANPAFEGEDQGLPADGPVIQIDGPRQQDGPRKDGPRKDGPRKDGPRKDARRDGPRADQQRPPDQRRDGPCKAKTCSDLVKPCGNVDNGCGKQIWCGACQWPEVCGALQPNQCGCKPTTCLAQKKDCDWIEDGCGKSLWCGSCPYPDECGLFQPNVCGCQPTTCKAAGKDCDWFDTGCGGTEFCGTCAFGEVCGFFEPNVCASSGCQANGKTCVSAINCCNGGCEPGSVSGSSVCCTAALHVCGNTTECCLDSICSGGLCCNYAGQKCTTGSCCSPLLCQNGTCCRQTGAACSYGSECCSKQCGANKKCT